MKNRYSKRSVSIYEESYQILKLLKIKYRKEKNRNVTYSDIIAKLLEDASVN